MFFLKNSTPTGLWFKEYAFFVWMFDPFRVISIRDCILSYRVDSITPEIFVGVGHALRSTMVCCKMWFRILFLRLTENSFALAEQTISTLADWHSAAAEAHFF